MGLQIRSILLHLYEPQQPHAISLIKTISLVFLFLIFFTKEIPRLNSLFAIFLKRFRHSLERTYAAPSSRMYSSPESSYLHPTST